MLEKFSKERLYAVCSTFIWKLGKVLFLKTQQMPWFLHIGSVKSVFVLEHFHEITLLKARFFISLLSYHLRLSIFSTLLSSALFVVPLSWSEGRFRAFCCSLSPLQFSLRFAWTLTDGDNRLDLRKDDTRREIDRQTVHLLLPPRKLSLSLSLLVSAVLTMLLFSSCFYAVNSILYITATSPFRFSQFTCPQRSTALTGYGDRQKER